MKVVSKFTIRSGREKARFLDRMRSLPFPYPMYLGLFAFPYPIYFGEYKIIIPNTNVGSSVSSSIFIVLDLVLGCRYFEKSLIQHKEKNEFKKKKKFNGLSVISICPAGQPASQGSRLSPGGLPACRPASIRSSKIASITPWIGCQITYP